ncbi:hypothetical protein JMJ35_001197 [Cladonia borealis]|uniref:C2H2-type domain-containing protein n=1 Tax=Cladonia borealis TaxID=184061 RepID=A0AA39RAC6_9LECA|nr:hypothetical protein JMJ35_001197 [Cladonia borealis]
MPQCCGRSFTYNGMRNHLDNSRDHYNEIECRWCFARWPTHAGKLRLKHEQAEHWYECDHCNSIFETESGLEDHIADEHPPNYCYGCKRQFQNLNNLNQHLKSSVHAGKNVKCPWCPAKFVNLTGVCLHLESGVCPSEIDRQKINRYCREVDPNHVFTTKQIGWHDTNDTPNIATSASWDGSCYRCYLCPSGFSNLRSLNQHLGSPAHQGKIYHCPRCRREYVSLSGLVNHLESESCGAFRFGGNPVGLGFVNQLRITG